MSRFAKKFTVRWADCDVNAHMRNTAYSEYGIEVRLDHLAGHGFGFERFAEMGFGAIMTREEIDYLREVRLGETFEVDYTLLGLSPDAARFKVAHDFVKEDGKPAARIVVSGGWLDLRTRRLRAPPEAIAAALHGLHKAEGFVELPALAPRP